MKWSTLGHIAWRPAKTRHPARSRGCAIRAGLYSAHQGVEHDDMKSCALAAGSWDLLWPKTQSMRS
jgi:hypothetical protein